MSLRKTETCLKQFSTKNLLSSSPSSTTDTWRMFSKVSESGSLVAVVPHAGRRPRGNRTVLEEGGEEEGGEEVGGEEVGGEEGKKEVEE